MRNLLVRQSFLLLIVCPAFVSVCAQKKPAAPNRSLEKYMERYSTFTDFGGAVLVMRGGKVLLRKAYGLADREWGVANTADTKFRIASISKPLTAVAILRLVEQNKLSLDDTLDKFLPGFPSGDKITIHMLLTHRSGLPRGHDMDVATEMTMTKEKALEIIKKKSLVFEPGTKTRYSNTGYLLLSYVIEKVTGESFEGFMQKNVFQPAGLNGTGIYNPEIIVPKIARFYRPENAAPGARVQKEFFANYAMFQGHGNLYSTVDDLAKFMSALRGTTLLSEASREKMLTKHYEDGEWGYGIDLTPMLGRKAFNHGGGFNGATGMATVFPEDDLIVILLSNSRGQANGLSRALAAITFGQEVEMPYQHVRVPIEPALVDKYAGNYGGGTILNKDGKLVLGDGTELVPESQTKFFESSDPNNTYEFVVGPDGKASAVVFSFYGVKRSIPRGN
ncbi:MAG TPA: serine hydrolase [Pyrinomonadaceae bacterium]